MREIRRKDRSIDRDTAEKLLTEAEYGVLASCGKDSMPYAVPLNYVYSNGFIYFHCALSGHKLDNIEDNPQVSFCVTGATNLRPSAFSTEYISAVAFGTAAVIEGAEKIDALKALVGKYSPAHIDAGDDYIAKKHKATAVVKITLSSLSGKQSVAK